MSVVGLHPEELLDKLAQGRLSSAENELLHAHLMMCATCRFELDLRRDCAEIAPDLLSPAPVIIPDTALDRRASPEPPRAVARRSRRSAWGLALAAALVGGVSLAAVDPRVRSFVAQSFATVAEKPPENVGSRGSAVAVRRAPPLVNDATPKAPKPEEKPTVQLEELPLAKGTPSPTEVRPAASVAQTPSALFHSANEARRAGDEDRAITLYHTLEAQFPNSEEARLSHATVGRLMLDRGDAKMALDDFDKYLSHGGTLGEEALVGRALALGKLGKRDAEAAAWREVLARFPKSIHARMARTRLAALDER